MADFNSLVADVMVITNRPDLIAETQNMVKSAILQLHRSDFYYKDLFETAIEFDTLDYLQTIDCRLLFPRYRALKYLRKFDPTDSNDENAETKFFDIITPEQALDSYGTALTDIIYSAGSVLQVKSSTQIQYALMGVYLNPVIEPTANLDSWVALEAPNAIVASAAAKMFGGILGNTTKANYWKEEAGREFLEVSNANIVAKGD